MRPLPIAPPPDSAGRAPGTSQSMPPAATNACASPTGQKPNASSQNQTNGEKPSYTCGRSTSSGPRPECSQSRRVVSNAVSMMSSSGQCCGMRRVVGVPIPKPLTSTGWFGRSRARSADVKTNVADPVDRDVAVVHADRVGDHARGEVVLGRERLVVPERPRDPSPVLARLDHDRGHLVARRAVALEVLVVRQRDHRQRTEVALRRHPLHRAARLAHGVAVVLARRVVQRPVQQHVVGGAAGDRVHGQLDRAGDLAEALEAARPARVHAEVLGHPVRADDADAVLDRVRARGREDRAGGEAVDLRDVESGVGDRGSGGVERDRTQWLVGVTHHRGLRVPDDRHLVGGREAPAHVVSNCERGHRRPGREVLEGDDDARPDLPAARRVRRADGRWCGGRPVPRARRRPSTNGTRSSKPGRNDWCITVHDRTTPRPLTGTKVKSGSVLWQCEQTMSGGIANVPHARAPRDREHVLGGGVPVRPRPVVGHRHRAAERRTFAHGMAPAACSAAMSSHE